MSCVEAYSVTTYNELRSVESASKMLCGKIGDPSHTLLGFDRERIEFSNIFNLTLLHRHYTLEENEKMIHIRDANADVASPRVSDTAVPTLLSVRKTEDGFIWVPLEFSENQEDRPIVSMLLANKEFLDKIGSTLESLNVLDLLGISICPGEEFDKLPDWIQLEKNNLETRTSTVEQVKADSIATENVIDTAWSFHGPKTRSCWRAQVCQQIGSGHASVFVHKRT